MAQLLVLLHSTDALLAAATAQPYSSKTTCSSPAALPPTIPVVAHPQQAHPASVLHLVRALPTTSTTSTTSTSTSSSVTAHLVLLLPRPAPTQGAAAMQAAAAQGGQQQEQEEQVQGAMQRQLAALHQWRVAPWVAALGAVVLVRAAA